MHTWRGGIGQSHQGSNIADFGIKKQKQKQKKTATAQNS
jgi:hypothetical protein